MKDTQAQEKWQELLAVAMVAGPAVQAVVELHAPQKAYGLTAYVDCAGCVGSIQGDTPSWPEDCTTTQVLARALGVELSSGERALPPSPPMPIRKYVVADGIELVIAGILAGAPDIDVQTLTHGMLKIVVTVARGTGVDVLECRVLTSVTRTPGAILAMRVSSGLEMILRWALR